jgi:glycosyltransferase involved in cell wall biosynthesis
VPESLRLALAIAGKDIRAELRSRTALLSATVFAALVLVVFNFARDPTVLAATDLAPSVLWVTFALAAMVALNRAFTIEREHGALDGLLLAPVPRGALFLGKLLANLAFVGMAEAVITLLRDPGLRRRMGDAGRHKIQTEASAETIAEQTLAVYRRAINDRAAPARARRVTGPGALNGNSSYHAR